MKETEDFRKKFDRELKSGLLGMLLLNVIARSKVPIYGYRIIKEVESLSNGDFVLPEGTVYPILNSMETRGLLESKWGEGSEGPRRKYYTITTLGRSSLRKIVSDWRSVSATINRILGKEEVYE